MKNTKTTIEYKKINNSVEYFKKYKRDNLWNLKKEEWQKAFRF